MSIPAPWQCPACDTWVAPHVCEHRCEPPEAGTPATVTYNFPLPAGRGGSAQDLVTEASGDS